MDPVAQAASVNYHILASGDCCVSRTLAAGQEYSGRRGPCIYTQFLIGRADDLAAFANHPFRLLSAAEHAGEITVLTNPPISLAPICLSDVPPGSENPASQLSMLAGPETCAAFADAIRGHECVGVYSRIPAARLFAELLDILSPADRATVTFTTGLRHSNQRRFRLFPLPENPAQRRQWLHQSGAREFELFPRRDSA
jgi:hypothetical protein